MACALCKMNQLQQVKCLRGVYRATPAPIQSATPLFGPAEARSTDCCLPTAGERVSPLDRRPLVATFSYELSSLRLCFISRTTSCIPEFSSSLPRRQDSGSSSLSGLTRLRLKPRITGYYFVEASTAGSVVIRQEIQGNRKWRAAHPPAMVATCPTMSLILRTASVN